MTEKKPIPAASPEAPAADNASISRRRFLAGGAAVVGGLALGGDALAGVLVRDRATSPHGERKAVIKRGGTLTVGSIGSTNDSLDPNKEASNMDLQRMFNLRDTLTYFGHNGFDLQYGLAEAIELSAGATVATVRLRKGVTWHNGKPLTADDLIFSINRILDPSDPHAGLLKSVNGKALKKLDSHTVQIGLELPGRDLPRAMVRAPALDRAGRARPARRPTWARAPSCTRASLPASEASSRATRTTGCRACPTSTSS